MALARQFHCLPVAIVFKVSDKVCYERNAGRQDRDFGPHVIRQQSQQMRRSIGNLKREGFRHMFVLRSVEEIEGTEIERTPLWNNRKSDHGPFDIIGDVHGCFDELVILLGKLGYSVKESEYQRDRIEAYVHPEGRKAVFVGDVVDRGPRILDTIMLVREMVRAESAYVVPGNHDMKLVKRLRGRDVQITHGLQNSLAELDALAAEAKEKVSKEVVDFLDSLVSHYVFDDGNLVVAHAGMREEMQGRGSGKVRDFALYGETTGETDEFGLPIRYVWASEYRGHARVIYGHTPVPEPEWLNRTINIDTGCVFGGKLTALRYPELELISVLAGKVYCEPSRPFQEAAPAELTAQQRHDELLDLDDVIGKRIIQTRLRGNVTVREENAIAALEVMSRFAADPKWLIYLPPTMSPSDTSREDGMLENPAEAFSYFRTEGIPTVVCQEKHMGSRAIVIVARDAEAARRRFGAITGEGGICYTRTGRRFFDDIRLEEEFLGKTRSALDTTGFWDEFQTDWVVLDCELMPWSAKAQELLRRQYAAVGAAARAGLTSAVSALKSASENGVDVTEVLPSYEARLGDAERFVTAYRNYCWPVENIDDLKLAPFHIMASEGAVHVDKEHTWHMQKITEIAEAAEGLLMPTQSKVVDVTEPASEMEATEWWGEITSRGGEGMVAKPLSFVARGRRGLAQPGVKCRGVEYLRIIYGPDYAEPANLDRLRARGLSPKRSLAIREFALGIEGLERFVRQEPLRRVHECVFGVLALESEPVDPRL